MTETVDHIAAREQAEAAEPLDLESLSGKRCPPAGRKSLQPSGALVLRLDELRHRHLVAHAADKSNARPILDRPARESLEPAFGHHGVIVEKDNVIAARPRQSLIAAGRKADVGGIVNDVDTDR